ncbi:MAG: AAA family ATPase [Saprospiraceae bacterium]|nr:AAA family ATPase [Saprospiraceae bacterium]MCF8248487.1 AAA family ATPase [Saprospiraceae bacterium]MCF8280558.1 AAA family ATPase [Bacteroidales bacterium]MCF8310221.1 AAA family ATPase [Saprospiraceae bacterium]MCF8439340.1 AAA family ATPase [Saprospiraceae bacterium]
MTKRLYVAATNQHVGKTTCTLGLVEAFRLSGMRVGYCKPVGQEAIDIDNLQVDKDALLFSTMMNFDLVAKIHSPVILGKGATQAFLDDSTKFPYESNIVAAGKFLEAQYEIVIYEGTGHPGVGSVVDLSNADVAALLDAPAILVVEGGVGYTIDRLNLCLSLFRERKVRIAGVIINKVLPDKIEKVRHYVGMKLAKWDIPLLGVLPYEKKLLYPLLSTISVAINGRVLFNPQSLNLLVENVVAASLMGSHNFEEDQGVLLVVSKNRLNEALLGIQRLSKLKGMEKTPLAGVIITGDGKQLHHIEDFDHEQYIIDHQIPVITTPLDTYGTAVKISHLEVKINVDTLGKASRAIELVRDNLDLSKIKW